MSPAQSLTAQQLAHAIAQFEKRVEAKRMEAEALDDFSTYIPAAAASAPDFTWKTVLTSIAERYFKAKHTQALIDLEILELQLRALKAQQSGIVGVQGHILKT